MHIFTLCCARFNWKLSVKVVFIFSSKTSVLAWFGLKQAENEPKTNHVSDLRLSTGIKIRVQLFVRVNMIIETSPGPHCKDTIPKIRDKSSQKRSCAASVYQFPPSCVCERFILIFPRDWSAYSAAGKYDGPIHRNMKLRLRSSRNSFSGNT